MQGVISKMEEEARKLKEAHAEEKAVLRAIVEELEGETARVEAEMKEAHAEEKAVLEARVEELEGEIARVYARMKEQMNRHVEEKAALEELVRQIKEDASNTQEAYAEGKALLKASMFDSETPCIAGERGNSRTVSLIKTKSDLELEGATHKATLALALSLSLSLTLTLTLTLIQGCYL